jgi:putative copper export protein
VERGGQGRPSAEGNGELHGEGGALIDVASLLEHAGGAGATLARAVSFAGTAGVVGALAFRRFVGATTLGDEGDAATEEARRFGFWSALILLATVPYRVVAQAKGLAFDGDPWLPMVPRILSTTWGHAAIWQAAAAFIAASAFHRLRSRQPHHWTQARVAALVLIAVPAFMGHAAAVESWAWGAIATDVIHVLAAGSWVGALSVLTACALRLRADPNGGFVLATYIEKFQPLAKRSVVMLVITGLVSSLLHLRAIGELTSTGYGAVLLTKVGLVFFALMLGYGHQMTATGQARTGGVRRLLPTFLIEWGLLVAVLLVTGLLSGSPPPGAE